MKKVVCFGEMLWDLLPSGSMPGGAPMNVAVHLSNFGLSVEMVSKVGSDILGENLVAFLANRNIGTDLVQKDATHPTGVVEVNISSLGEITYTIVEAVAWDYIECSAKLEEAVADADLISYCSLACRSDQTFQTFQRILAYAKVKAFDVNLRPPFYAKERLLLLLETADIVKMNEEELREIGSWDFEETDEFVLAEKVRKRYNINKLCLTRGKLGAALFTPKETILQSGFPVVVQDTVGSGDAFFAGYLSSILLGVSDAEALRFACGTGALVATHKGAVPQISALEVNELMQK